MKGGNTDELYKDDGRLKMAESLKEQHPDVTKIGFRFGHVQHVVDYAYLRNKNKLIRKSGIDIPEGINNYGMVLKTFIPEKEEKTQTFIKEEKPIPQQKQFNLFKKGKT